MLKTMQMKPLQFGYDAMCLRNNRCEFASGTYGHSPQVGTG